MYLHRTTTGLTTYTREAHGLPCDYAGETLNFLPYGEEDFVVVVDPDERGRCVLYNEKTCRYYPARELTVGQVYQDVVTEAYVPEFHSMGQGYESYEGTRRVFDLIYILDASKPIPAADWRVVAEQWDLAADDCKGVIALAAFSKSERAYALLKYL